MSYNDQHINPDAMTKKQLAAKYEVCVKTFNKWIAPFLDDIGPLNNTNYFTPKQVEIIFQKLGEP